MTYQVIEVVMPEPKITGSRVNLELVIPDSQLFSETILEEIPGSESQRETF